MVIQWPHVSIRLVFSFFFLGEKEKREKREKKKRGLVSLTLPYSERAALANAEEGLKILGLLFLYL